MDIIEFVGAHGQKIFIVGGMLSILISYKLYKKYGKRDPKMERMFAEREGQQRQRDLLK